MINCQWFQDKLFEYLDGELSASAQSEIEAHLQRCEACRQGVQAHQALAARFRHETDSLVLRPEEKRRIEAALVDDSQGRDAALRRPGRRSAPTLPKNETLPFWRRFAWPAAVAAALLVAAGLSFRRPFHARVQSTEARLAPAPATISLRFSSCEPTYTFRREKDRVIDALTCTPRVVEENLSLSMNQKHIPQTQERKTPL
jgi:anti-sigma factor RsiW